MASGRASPRNGDLSHEEQESGFSRYSLSEGKSGFGEREHEKSKAKDEEEGERVEVAIWRCQLSISQDPPFLLLFLVYFL